MCPVLNVLKGKVKNRKYVQVTVALMSYRARNKFIFITSLTARENSYNMELKRNIYSIQKIIEKQNLGEK